MVFALLRTMMVAVISLSLSGASAIRVSATSHGHEAGLKERPVMKVVRLLQDMQGELERDLEQDKVVHKKLMCWCTDNRREKSQSIETKSQAKIVLKGTKEEVAAQVSKLQEQRESTRVERDRDSRALQNAHDMRIKEAKEFKANKLSLVAAISAAKNAIVVLSTHHPELSQLRSAAQGLVQARVPELLSAGGLRGSDLRALQNFLQEVPSAGAGAPAASSSSFSSFLSLPVFQGYKPQSGQIFGILKEMLKDFQQNLERLEQTERQAIDDYVDLKSAKEEEITSATRALAKLDTTIADNSQVKADTAQDLDDTRTQVSLDRQFLTSLEKRCAETTREYNSRVKGRLEEIAAVQDTIKILNTDAAFETFDKGVGSVSLVQTAGVQQQSSSYGRLQRRAAALLEEAARGHSQPRLAFLAQSVRIDGFEKVLTAIEKMRAELKVQQQDEVKHRDWCRDELAANQRATTAAEEKKESLEVKIADLSKRVKSIGEEAESVRTSVSELQLQMKRASEVREAENADFQQTVVDQRISQSILKKALERMRQVYSFAQEEEGEEVADPAIAMSGNATDPGKAVAKFDPFGKNAGGKRVVRMLKTVIDETRAAEEEAIRAEEDAQTAYEELMKDSNKEITASSKRLNDLQAASARARESLSTVKTDLKQAVLDLEGLNEVLGDVHKSCDFLLANFAARQDAHTAEMDVLREAKAILSGDKVGGSSSL